MNHPKTFGGDRVVQKGEQILVYTGREMPDWHVRKYRRTAVVIDDRIYFVAKRDDIDRRTVRYTLEPWPEDHHDLPGTTVYYCEEYVRLRDRSMSEVKRREAVFHVLRPVKSLIGFLPSSAKRRLEASYGISARAATFSSLWIELVVFLAIGVVIWIDTFGNLRAAASLSGSLSGASLILIPILFFLLLELAVRYGHYLSEASSPYGFCEWIFRRSRRGTRH